MRLSDERGFTLVELMIAIFLFSILSIGFYQVMFSSVRGSNRTSDIAQASEEARLGFNRMIRDTRETTLLVLAEDDRYRIWVDFNGNELVDDDEYEYLEYSFLDGSIWLSALTGPDDPDDIQGDEGVLPGTEVERLAGNIRQVDGGDPVFAYASNFLIYDLDGNGETTFEELEDSSDAGLLEGDELEYVSDVNYAFIVSVEGNERTFFGQAQIRNRRFSDL